MTRTIICLLTILLIIGVVGRYEYRYAQQQTRHEQIVNIYESRLDMVIEAAAGMEAEIEAHKFHRSRPYQDDMNSGEFLEVLADYLARDGRCKVVIERVDWSTWQEAY